MIGRTNACGGGAGLNFSIVGGTTAPRNPKENMIWLNTSEKIASWVFSATEPEAPENGMAWISIGKASTVAFNALKKNSIMIYPMVAKQYIGNVWVAVTAMSYQGGAWKNWRVYLFDNGLVDTAGAWAFETDNANGKATIGKTLVMNADTCPGNITNYACELYLEEAYDCSSASTLNIHFVSVKTTGSNGQFGLYIRDRSTGETLQSFDNLDKTDWTLTVDISHLDSIQAEIRTNPWGSMKNYCSLEIDAIWLA